MNNRIVSIEIYYPKLHDFKFGIKEEYYFSPIAQNQTEAKFNYRNGTFREYKITEASGYRLADVCLRFGPKMVPTGNRSTSGYDYEYEYKCSHCDGEV